MEEAKKTGTRLQSQPAYQVRCIHTSYPDKLAKASSVYLNVTSDDCHRIKNSSYFDASQSIEGQSTVAAASVPPLVSGSSSRVTRPIRTHRTTISLLPWIQLIKHHEGRSDQN